ncbi:hypothetical protein TNCV_1153081 [Trichonephila clavipes]|nr:hypothetical protein TNCV_1153081 [Trichonephila clavipes]
MRHIKKYYNLTEKTQVTTKIGRRRDEKANAISVILKEGFTKPQSLKWKEKKLEQCFPESPVST